MVWRRFSCVFLAVALVAGATVLVLGQMPSALACRPTATPDTFVAECRGVVAYDHAAYGLGLEPAVLAALARAEVVFLGNSRAQFAFSAAAVARWFEDRAVPAYRAGFGYEEGSPFALDVLARAGARPRLVVVNADPFFTARLSPPASRIRDAPWRTRIAGLRNRTAMRARRVLCPLLPSTLCRGRYDAVHRVRASGAWAWQDSFRPSGGATAVDVDPGEPLPSADAASDLARAFLERLGLAPDCLVLTAIPNSKVAAEAFAADLAAGLGARLIVPRIEGLRTVDGSHLDAESAERWSSAFLEHFAPVLDACGADQGRTGAKR